MPAIEVNRTYRDGKEKAERIAFVKRVVEQLYVNNEVSCTQSIECAELLYRTLKEWESKQ